MEAKPISHQTVRLARGKHRHPAAGACVMELASMLAGEAFSDRPRCVCPVIGGLLRAYNDVLDDHRRQDLYPYASAVVGSYAGEEAERARAERLVAWAHSLRPRRLLRRWPRPRVDHRLGRDGYGEYAVRCMPRPVADDEHNAVLSLIEELIAIDRPRPAPATPRPLTAALDGCPRPSAERSTSTF